jgi:hypothetical protein
LFPLLSTYTNNLFVTCSTGYEPWALVIDLCSTLLVVLNTLGLPLFHHNLSLNLFYLLHPTPLSRCDQLCLTHNRNPIISTHSVTPSSPSIHLPIKTTYPNCSPVLCHCLIDLRCLFFPRLPLSIPQTLLYTPTRFYPSLQHYKSLFISDFPVQPSPQKFDLSAHILGNPCPNPAILGSENRQNSHLLDLLIRHSDPINRSSTISKILSENRISPFTPYLCHITSDSLSLGSISVLPEPLCRLS